MTMWIVNIAAIISALGVVISAMAGMRKTFNRMIDTILDHSTILVDIRERLDTIETTLKDHFL